MVHKFRKAIMDSLSEFSLLALSRGVKFKSAFMIDICYNKKGHSALLVKITI